MEIRLLQRSDLDLLCATSPGLFDRRVRPKQALAFLKSDLHLMAVAIDEDDIVSFASGTIALHPDQKPSLIINEVGTRDDYQRRGLASQVASALLDAARDAGCKGAWLGTEPDNDPALALYRKLGGKEVVFHGFGWDGAFE